MNEKSFVNTQLEHLQAKYVGTGHSDITKHEWVVNQHRDSLASYIGHDSILMFMAVAQNESIARMRYDCLERMFRPCGPPPKKQDDDF